tara:strand:+ start:126 stop:704 length:579 start_codon:yes stop_codon:yes gene_type:complete
MKNSTRIELGVVIAILVVCILLVVRGCNKVEETGKKVTELRTERIVIKSAHSVDSAKYNMEIQYLNAKLVELENKVADTKVEYVTVYRDYLADPTDSVVITEVVEVCNDLVIEQAEVIIAKDSVIVTQGDYIEVQDSTIMKLDSVLVESHNVLETVEIANLKLKTKLKRTRKIGVVGFITGVVGGIILTIAI